MKFILIIFLILLLGCTNGITTPEDKVIEINSETWDKEVLQVKRLVMVDFYATWCSPCQKLAVIVNKLAKENYPKLKVCKIDIDKNWDIYVKYKVRGIPVLLFFKEGKEVERIIGLQTKKYIQNKIDYLLKKKDKKDCEGGTCLPPEEYRR
jgi:thioredoxin 1